SDQWGNIVTGTELIRRKGGGDAFALTTKLITKADGSKFGKSEGGNLWLDRNRTSPYQLYQYFFNTADEDAARLIRIFTLKGREEIEALEAEHDTNRGAKLLQRELAAAVTTRVHAAEDTQRAEEASQILFSKQATEILKRTEESVVLELFADVPQGTVSRSEVEAGMGIQELLAAKSGFLPSNSEARRALKENSVSLNKQKVQDGYTVTLEDLIGGRYLLLQRGKKKQFLVRVK
ncbi:MAG: tyrosine--tRNA ligase, partial [Bacteroidota bacterium]